MTEIQLEPARLSLNYATVRQHAQYNGLYLVSTMRAEEQDRWWLSSSTNWVTTEAGKPLAEIDAVLDDMDGGEWARDQAEAARRKAQEAAEQEALRLRLVAETDADDDQDEDEDEAS
jgi:hypothetical protein